VKWEDEQEKISGLGKETGNEGEDKKEIRKGRKKNDEIRRKNK
jgi:hypothetical protein